MDSLVRAVQDLAKIAWFCFKCSQKAKRLSGIQLCVITGLEVLAKPFVFSIR